MSNSDQPYMSNPQTPFFLITGASRGIGKAYAYELANRGYHLILVASSEERLSVLTDELQGLGIEVHYFATDLSIKENLVELANWVNANFELVGLVNNAGIGGTKRFMEADIDYLDKIIQVNIRATSLLCRLLLPNLMRQNQAYILNVSSMASFSPIGYKTVYPASKRFLQHFSIGLYQELKETPVHVSVTHPGPVKTNAYVTERIEKQGIFGKLGLLSPEKVAQISINQLLRKKPVILLGWFNHVLWGLMSLVPNWIKVPLISRTVKRELFFFESVSKEG